MAVVTRLFESPEIRYSPEDLRVVEALLFASAEPLEEGALAARLPIGCDIKGALEELQRQYSGRGVQVVRLAGRWMFRTAADMAWLLAREEAEKKKLSRAAIETLAIVAYHQPATRAEIEDIRGVAVSKGALDVLMEAGFVRMRGRRKAPGRPITYGTTHKFLIHFGLEQVSDLPGLDELQAAGLFEGKLPPGYGVPRPDDGEALRPDEEPLDPSDSLEEAWGPIRREAKE
jgi:segregation and condensation protein B